MRALSREHSVGVMTAISPSCMAMKFFVCLLNAAVSEAT